MPPLGVTSNFKDPESRGYQFIITAIISLALALFFASGRVYTKIKRIGLGPWGWDDSTESHGASLRFLANLGNSRLHVLRGRCQGMPDR